MGVVKTTCSLKNQCQTLSLIYRADVENEVKDETKIYFGLAATTLKARFGNHKKRFQPEATQPRVAEIYMVIKSCRNSILLCLAEKLHLIEYFDGICLTTVDIKINYYLKVQ